jgi:hypothetical protein
MVRHIRKDGGYTGSVEIRNPKDFRAPKVPTGVVQPAPIVPPPPSRTESSRPAPQG